MSREMMGVCFVDEWVGVFRWLLIMEVPRLVWTLVEWDMCMIESRIVSGIFLESVSDEP
jgi:hypothetical protein